MSTISHVSPDVLVCLVSMVVVNEIQCLHPRAPVRDCPVRGPCGDKTAMGCVSLKDTIGGIPSLYQVFDRCCNLHVICICYMYDCYLQINHLPSLRILGCGEILALFTFR